MRLRRALVACGLAGAALASPRELRAETEGRISLYNVYAQVSGPDASYDAVLLRIWLRQERIGGRKMSFHIDSRSDIPVLASAGEEVGVGGVFNQQCRGDAQDIPHGDCAKVPIRDQRVGQLLQVAGIYDAYFQLGELAQGSMAYSIGRKTIYEAGLTAVDGLTVEKQMDRARFGIFGGLAPDPLTRMVNAQHQIAGGYYAFQHERAWIRLGAAAQLFEAEMDRVTIYNHDFWSMSRSLRLAVMLHLDVVPAAEERLVQVDLTYRPSGQYRFRASVTRFRPWDFANSPSHIIQAPEQDLVDDFKSATRDPASSVRGRLNYGSPEVMEDELRTSAVNQVKLVGHYTSARSFTPFVSLAFRSRDYDAASGFQAGVGVYAYDPFDLGLVGRVRLDHVAGFTNDHDRVTLDLEQRLSDSLAFGGGLVVGSVKYHGHDRVFNEGYPTSSQVMGVQARVRNDRIKGISLYGELEYLSETRDMGTQVPDSGADSSPRADEASTAISVTAGVAYRF